MRTDYTVFSISKQDLDESFYYFLAKRKKKKKSALEWKNGLLRG